MGRHSIHDGKASIQENRRVTRSSLISTRRLTRSGKEFSIAVSPHTSNHAICKANEEFQAPAAACVVGIKPSPVSDTEPKQRAASSNKPKSRHLEESTSISDDSEATIPITSDVLRSDLRFKNLLPEINKSKRHFEQESCVTIDFSTIQICLPCLSGSRVFGERRRPQQLVLSQPEKEYSSVASLFSFRQRMKHSLSLALGVVTPTVGDADIEKETLIYNARTAIEMKLYVSFIMNEVSSAMGTLARELVGEASYTCMQESLLSGLMNEEIGVVCGKIAETNQSLQRLNNTVNAIVCEHLEDLYEFDSC